MTAALLFSLYILASRTFLAKFHDILRECVGHPCGNKKKEAKTDS